MLQKDQNKLSPIHNVLLSIAMLIRAQFLKNNCEKTQSALLYHGKGDTLNQLVHANSVTPATLVHNDMQNGCPRLNGVVVVSHLSRGNTYVVHENGHFDGAREWLPGGTPPAVDIPYYAAYACLRLLLFPPSHPQRIIILVDSIGPSSPSSRVGGVCTCP